jgi:hypothetical protein
MTHNLTCQIFEWNERTFLLFANGFLSVVRIFIAFNEILVHHFLVCSCLNGNSQVSCFTRNFSPIQNESHSFLGVSFAVTIQFVFEPFTFNGPPITTGAFFVWFFLMLLALLSSSVTVEGSGDIQGVTARGGGDKDT